MCRDACNFLIVLFIGFVSIVDRHHGFKYVCVYVRFFVSLHSISNLYLATVTEDRPPFPPFFYVFYVRTTAVGVASRPKD